MKLLRQYFYEIVNARSRQDGSPLTRIYIWAKPSFSHREMSSKQEQILDRLTDLDCPLEGAMQLAFATNLSVQSLCIAKIDHFDKVKKEISFNFVHSLEIVLYKTDIGKKIIAWLQTLWTGKWQPLKTELMHTSRS